jgi:hypothetical protein
LVLAYDRARDVSVVGINWASEPYASVVCLHSADSISWQETMLPLTNSLSGLRYLWLVIPDEGLSAPAIRELDIR